VNLLFYVDYTKAKVGFSPTPAPTMTIYRVAKSTGIEDPTPVANAQAVTASALAGRFFLLLTGLDLQTYDYHGRSTTSDTTVDLREPPVLWTRWSEAVTTDASGNVTVAGFAAAALTALANAVWAAASRTLTAFGFTVNLAPGASVTYTGPVAPGGAVNITQGDDYAAADGRQLDWTGGSPNQWPDLTGATISLNVNDARVCVGTGSTGGLGTCSVVTPTGTQKIRAEPSAAQTSALQGGVYDFDVKATLANGHVCTLIRGTRQFTVNDSEAS